MITTINSAMTALYTELAAEIPDVLHESFTFAALWADLARIAGEPLPRDVAAVLDVPIGFVPVAGPSFGQSKDQPVYAD